MKFFKFLLSRRFLLILQLIASAVFGYIIYKFNILPLKYFLVMVAVLLLLLILLSFMMKYKKEKTENKHSKNKYKSAPIRVYIGKILSLAITCALCFGASFARETDSTIEEVASVDNAITTRYNLYTLKNSYSSVDDLEGKVIANLSSYDSSNFNTATKALNKKISYTEKNYTSYSDCVKDLYRGEVDAVLMNAYYEMMMRHSSSQWTNRTSAVWYTDMKELASTTSSKKNLSESTFTIYVSGVDTRKNDVTDTSRSDSNMLVTINPKTHQILMTSIPRDYYIDFANASGAKDKLTHSALCGTLNTLRSIENFMDIDIDFYVRVNFQSLVKLVDAVDGIEVYSDKEFVPWTNKNVKIVKGTQHMDGATALAFARERKVYSEGDRHRAANQQAVLKAVLKKMMSTKILTNYSEILEAVAGLFQTNVNSLQIKQLINYQLDENPSWDFQSSVLTGTDQKVTGGFFAPTQALYYMIPDDDSVSTNSQYIKDMYEDKKISIEEDTSLTED